MQSVDEVAGGKLEFRGDIKPEQASDDEALRINMQGQFEFEWEKRQEQKKPTQAVEGLTIISGDLGDAENQRMQVAFASAIRLD